MYDQPHYGFRFSIFRGWVPPAEGWLSGWVGILGGVTLLAILYFEMPQFDVRILRAEMPFTAKVFLVATLALFLTAALSEVLPRIGFALTVVGSLILALLGISQRFQALATGDPFFEMKVSVSACYVVFGLLTILGVVVCAYLHRLQSEPGES